MSIETWQRLFITEILLLLPTLLWLMNSILARGIFDRSSRQERLAAKASWAVGLLTVATLLYAVWNF